VDVIRQVCIWHSLANIHSVYISWYNTTRYRVPRVDISVSEIKWQVINKSYVGLWLRLAYLPLSDSDIPSRRRLRSSPDRTTLPAQHCRSSGLLCRWSDSLEPATGQSPWPGAHQQQLHTIAVSSWPLSTHSAVEMMLHVSALLLILTLTLLSYHSSCRNASFLNNGWASR